MGYQEYSKVCEIFKSGVEREIFIGPFKATASVDTWLCIMPAGKEMVPVEAYVKNLTASASSKVVVNLYRLTAASASTEIASVSFSATTSIGCIARGTGIVSATAFTSTDYIAAKLGANNSSDAEPFKLILRYRDK